METQWIRQMTVDNGKYMQAVAITTATIVVFYAVSLLEQISTMWHEGWGCPMKLLS